MKIKYFLVLVLIVCVLNECAAKKKSKKSGKGMVLRKKETNPINFVRLVVMRLIYGIATRVGFGEQISEALGGVFVPPGADYDYGESEGLGLFDREDDYDY